MAGGRCRGRRRGGDHVLDGATSPAGATVPPDTTVPGEDDRRRPATATITVTGHGTVKVTPDIATVNAGVQTTAPTPAGGDGHRRHQVAGLVDTLKAVGVADEDIQTSGLSLYPTFGDDGRRSPGTRRR